MSNPLNKIPDVTKELVKYIKIGDRFGDDFHDKGYYVIVIGAVLLLLGYLVFKNPKMIIFFLIVALLLVLGYIFFNR